jgi:hypothetical protein
MHLVVTYSKVEAVWGMSHAFQHIEWTVQAIWGWVLSTFHKNARILSLDGNTKKALEDSTTLL